jgi:ribosomal protein L16 Arg81 hydroxylase
VVRTDEIMADTAPENPAFDLAKLLHPISVSQFFAEYWEEKPLVIGRDDQGYYKSIVSLERIDPLLTVLPPEAITVTDSDHRPDEADVARADGSLDVVKACQLLAEGTTIVFGEAHKRIETLAALCRELERDLGAPLQCNLYLTPANGQGFEAHYDTHDVLLLQIAGAKEWTIFDSPVRLPLGGQPFDPDRHRIGAATDSFVLQAGDFLYIPRGFVHAARSADKVSLHATLGVLAYRWADVMIETMAQLCLSDPAFRRALPVSLGRPDFDLASARRSFAELLSRAIERADPDRVIERIADEFVVGRRAIIPGQLMQALTAKHLSLGDEIGARSGLLYRLQQDGEHVRVRSQGREITLSLEVINALKFALENKRYLVRDLPGDLADEDKLNLAKRLIDEGLVSKLSGC